MSTNTRGTTTDPTQTVTARRRYTEWLRGRFATISAVVREAIRSDDIFGVRVSDTKPPSAEALETAVPDLAGRTPISKANAFVAWLRRRLTTLLTAKLTAKRNPYVRGAYLTGIRLADQDLRGIGRDAPTSDERTDAGVFSDQLHYLALLALFRDQLDDIRTVIDATAGAVLKVVTNALQTGTSPTGLAKRVTDRIEHVGKYRATLVGEVGIVSAVARSMLNRYKEYGITHVGAVPEAVPGPQTRGEDTGNMPSAGRPRDIIETKITTEIEVRQLPDVEYVTANDMHVCEDCQALAGNIYPISEAYGIIPQHPRCRCRWSLVDADEERSPRRSEAEVRQHVTKPEERWWIEGNHPLRVPSADQAREQALR